MHSCLYEGAVSHRRRSPVTHRFRRSLAMAWLDLDELPALTRPGGPLAARSLTPCAFRRADHLFSHAEGLADEVRRLVRQAAGRCAAGPIRVLTQLRWYGQYFSPLNLFYLYNESGRVAQVLAEVNNTPWRERHAYALTDANRVGDADQLRFRHPKAFHVSPFMGMQAEYLWRLNEPGERLRVALTHLHEGRPLFDAGMALRRRPLTAAGLRSLGLRRPFMTAQVLAAIYFQAFLLWSKRCPYYPHPRNPTPQG